MSKYSVILSNIVSKSTKISVFELCENGESVFESFVEQIQQEGNLSNDLSGAIRNLELAADLVRLPKTKFRELNVPKLDVKLYEAKYGSIRIYHYHEEKTGRIIVLGGKKETQDKDIKSVVKTIKDYKNEQK